MARMQKLPWSSFCISPWYLARYINQCFPHPDTASMHPRPGSCHARTWQYDDLHSFPPNVLRENRLCRAPRRSFSGYLPALTGLGSNREGKRSLFDNQHHNARDIPRPYLRDAYLPVPHELPRLDDSSCITKSQQASINDLSRLLPAS